MTVALLTADRYREQCFWWPRTGSDDGDPFGAPRPLSLGPEAHTCTSLSAVQDADGSIGLLLHHSYHQEVTFFGAVWDGDRLEPRFERRGRLEGSNPVVSFSDQAWPCVADTNGDGVWDLTIGHGYGFVRTVANSGSNAEPSLGEPELIADASSEPIRLGRGELLGDPDHWHDMGYP